MQTIIFSPPVTFLILLVFIWLMALWCSKLAIKHGTVKERVSEAYSCGEQFSEHLIQPDYSQFFPFAFFFTILHVVALVIATVPTETLETFWMAITYLAVALIGMVTLLRKGN
jgi:NADH-quinone oxidoreductase subunit A